MVRINFQTREKNGCKCNAGIGELVKRISPFHSHVFLSFFHKKFLCFTFYVKKKKKKNIIYQISHPLSLLLLLL